MSEEQFKWATKLKEYDLKIQYKSGKYNVAADALSMRTTFIAIAIIKMDDLGHWEAELQKEPVTPCFLD